MKTIFITFLLSVLTILSQPFTLRDTALIAGLNPSAAAAFYPTQLSGCSLWLAADQSQLAGYTNGQAITTWTDNSINGFTFTTTEPYAMLFTNSAFANGKPAFLSSQTRGLETTTRDLTNYVATNAATHFILAKLRPGQTGIKLGVWFQNATNQYGLWFYNGNLQYYSGDGVDFMNSAASFATNNTWILFEAIRNGTTGQIVTNGGVLNNDTSWPVYPYAGINGVFVAPAEGNFNYGVNGEIAEFILYKTALSTNDRLTVRTYFTNKYGL